MSRLFLQSLKGCDRHVCYVAEAGIYVSRKRHKLAFHQKIKQNPPLFNGNDMHVLHPKNTRIPRINVKTYGQDRRPYKPVSAEFLRSSNFDAIVTTSGLLHRPVVNKPAISTVSDFGAKSIYMFIYKPCATLTSSPSVDALDQTNTKGSNCI